MFAKYECFAWICTQHARSQQIRFRMFSTCYSSLNSSPTEATEQMISNSKEKMNHNRNFNNLPSHVKHSEDATWNLDSPVQNKTLKIKRIIKHAEELLGINFHRFNNSLLLNSFDLASTKNENKLFESKAKLIMSSIQKLGGSDHPLLFLTKDINPVNFQQSLISSFQLRSMIVLLVAKLFGFSGTLYEKEQIETTNKQRTLAEITENIYSAYRFHQAVVEIPQSDLNCSKLRKKEKASVHHGNKVTTLIGDLLLVGSYKGLASLKNARVQEQMSVSITDFAESEIIAKMARESLKTRIGQFDITDAVNTMKLSDNRLDLNYDTWLRRTSLSIGSLLRQSCFSSLILAGHNDKVCNLAGEIGCKIGLVLQAQKDLMIFENDENWPQQLDYCSLPVIFYLQRHPNLTSAFRDDHNLREEIKHSPYALGITREKLLVLSEDANSLLDNVGISSSSCQLLKEFLKFETEV